MSLKSVLLTLLALSLVACSAPTKEQHTDEHEESGHSENEVNFTPEQQNIAGIKVETVSTRMMQSSLEAPGTITSTTKGRAIVTPPVAGRLVRLNVQAGDAVKQGQTIGVIESTELAEAWAMIANAEQSRDAAKASLSESQAQSQLAKAKLVSAEQTLQRQKEFAQAGAFNTAALQQAQSDLNDAQSQLLSAQKELSIHQENLRRLENLFKEGLVSKSDLQEAQLELQKDEIIVTRLQSRVTSAKATYDREKVIADKGLLNSREVQTAEAEVRSAKLEVERSKVAIQSAQAALKSAQKAVANAQSTYRTYSGGAAASGGRVNLTAPISGTITHLDVTQGQAVDRTQALCEIENLNSVWVTANVPEKDAAKIKTGSKVRITVPSYPGLDFMGTVQVIGSQIDSNTRSIPVQCLVTGTEGKLKSEMFANVHIGIGRPENTLAIPASAIVNEGAKTFIFIQENGEFIRHEVNLGHQDEGYVEVISGIEIGQEVAVEGAFILKSQLAKDELKGHDH